MKFYLKNVFIILLLGIVCLGLIACEKKQKKEAKVVVTEYTFSLRQDKDHSYVVDAAGKIQNSGEVDVKNVVVTGFCKSCSEIFVVGKWFISGIEKMPHEKDTISYLSAGNEEEFHFQGVANIYNQPGHPEPELPQDIGVIIQSFEPVEKE